MLTCKLYSLSWPSYTVKLLTLSICVSHTLLYRLNNITTANFPLADNYWTLPWQASPALASHFAKKGAAQAAATNHWKLTVKAHAHATINPDWYLLASFIFFLYSNNSKSRSRIIKKIWIYRQEKSQIYGGKQTDRTLWVRCTHTHTQGLEVKQTQAPCATEGSVVY